MTMLPWAPAHLAETRHVLGENFWPYGLEANRVTLEAQWGTCTKHRAIDCFLGRRYSRGQSKEAFKYPIRIASQQA